ncbi:MAG: hypothetical protein Q8N96_13200 [Methylovulum sp.]|nr:hypothetical protein [Methylovulum sp.]
MGFKLGHRSVRHGHGILMLAGSVGADLPHRQLQGLFHAHS